MQSKSWREDFLDESKSSKSTVIVMTTFTPSFFASQGVAYDSGRDVAVCSLGRGYGFYTATEMLASFTHASFAYK